MILRNEIGSILRGLISTIVNFEDSFILGFIPVIAYSKNKLATMRRFILISTGLFLVLANLSLLTAQIVYEAPKKKLIDFGRHSPFLKDFKERMKDYEKGPFNGLAVKLSTEVGKGNIFMVDNWEKVTAETKDAERKIASSIQTSPVLTDNFLVLFGASQMDWFSDEDWARVDAHLRYAAQLARAAHFKGILWDPEPYKPGKNPWKYEEQEKKTQYSYEVYYNQIRKRGAQFIQTLQEEFPSIVILSLRELSDWQNGSPFSMPMLPVINRENTITKLKDAYSGLHVPFYVGILDAIRPDVTFIDGNEEAYYYTSPVEYYKVRNTLIDDAKALIPPGLWSKHSCSFKLGQAITPEYIAGNWQGEIPFPSRLSGQGVMMTPAEKAKWMEHNAYYALRTSDKYA